MLDFGSRMGSGEIEVKRILFTAYAIWKSDETPCQSEEIEH